MYNTVFYYSNISELYAIKDHSKKICYEIYDSNLKSEEGSEYIKTAIDLTFDKLYDHQINEIIGELSLYLIYNGGSATVQEIIDLQQYSIDNYKPEYSIKGILEYIINTACRQAYIELLHIRTPLYATT